MPGAPATTAEIDAVSWALALIRERVQQNFYGKLTIKFEGGHPVHATTEASLKPPARAA